MLKSNTTDLPGFVVSPRLSSLTRKFTVIAENVRAIRLFSEDTIYKHYILTEYMPVLYRKHTAEAHASCVFCNHLVYSGCHRQCLKCSMGKYSECKPLLPGLLNCDSIYPYNGDQLRLPWYYSETCACFSRLPEENYFRNLQLAFSSAAIYNFEVLEGLEKGLLSGEKPCHICASTDYGIYKKCYGQGDYHACSPCRKIADELGAFYKNRNPAGDANPEAALSLL
jgi:hypothetical protein